jgi:hypothetical protein
VPPIPLPAPIPIPNQHQRQHQAATYFPFAQIPITQTKSSETPSHSDRGGTACSSRVAKTKKHVASPCCDFGYLIWVFGLFGFDPLDPGSTPPPTHSDRIDPLRPLRPRSSRDSKTDFSTPFENSIPATKRVQDFRGDTPWDRGRGHSFSKGPVCGRMALFLELGICLGRLEKVQPWESVNHHNRSPTGHNHLHFTTLMADSDGMRWHRKDTPTKTPNVE